MKTLIRNIGYYSPENGEPLKGNILISEGKIEKFIDATEVEGAKVIDGKFQWLLPGFIDMHVHFREPGGEEKETLETGSRAALAGGYTSVVCMPNTQPVPDHTDAIDDLLARTEKLPCQVLLMGSISKGLAGEEKTDFSLYKHPRFIGVTDDGRPVSNAAILAEALQDGLREGLMVGLHCEDESMMFDRSINQGRISRKLNLQGVPVMAEAIMIHRDLYLAEKLNCPLHIQHVSAAESVRLIREAKARGVLVSCEAAPHHFSLTEEAVLTRGSMAKMSPPLRTQDDVKAVQKGLKDGTIDVIATDHAPHLDSDKTDDLIHSANGIIGLETAFSVGNTYLVDQNILSLKELAYRMSSRPAKLLGLESKGEVSPGMDADLVLVDPNRRWIVDSQCFYSKARNTPYHAMALRGKVTMTMVNGEVRYQEEG
ncbi:MAG: dihydroorotase [Tindallia sp. MSAO_Bac2]|nr:MAG: dihydroorotase [Tindallia sp. MSAO_Bac2]